MSKITQYSRISHHTLTKPDGTFSVPNSEDFTDGTWTESDLALSEIGINEWDQRAYIRIGPNIKEINLTGSGANNTIYTADGVLTNDRLVDAGSKSLTFIQKDIYNYRHAQIMMANGAQELKAYSNDGYISSVNISPQQGIMSSSTTSGENIVETNPDGVRFVASDYGPQQYNVFISAGTNIFDIQSPSNQYGGRVRIGGDIDCVVYHHNQKNTAGTLSTDIFNIAYSQTGLKSIKYKIHAWDSGNQKGLYEECICLSVWDGTNWNALAITQLCQVSTFTSAHIDPVFLPGGGFTIKVYGEPGLDLTWTAFIETNTTS